MNKYLNEIIGDYQIISYDENTKLYNCQCLVCKHIKTTTISNFHRLQNKHNYLNCNEDYLIYEYNTNKNDDYIYKGDSGLKKNNEKLFKIECQICGNIKLVTCDNINRCSYYHNSMNCGDKVFEDRIGEIYEDIQIDKLNSIYHLSHDPIYECHCIICGRKKNMRYVNIASLKGTSHHNCTKDILNQPYVEILRKKWSDMRERTTNPLNPRYSSYGARGISSEDYRNFIDFYDDMYESFIDHINKYGIENTTLERINVNESYIKSNIRWATWEEQSNNFQRTTYFKVIKPDGTYSIERNVDRYEREHGFTHNFIRNRLFGKVKSNSYNGIVYELINAEDVNYEIFAN